MNPIKRFISSNYGPVIIGIIFTGFVGLFVNQFLQGQIISREQEFEIYKRKISSAEELLKEVINLINSRMFSLQRVIWSSKSAKISAVNRDWRDYRNQIEKWNFTDMSYRTRLDLYFGGKIASRFMDNSEHVKKSDSIHAYFYAAHQNVLNWKSCLRKACSYRKTEDKLCRINRCKKEKQISEKSFSDLKEKVNYYVRDLYFEYRKKYLKRVEP